MSIKAISVSKTYPQPSIPSKGIEAVKDISLDINEGSYTTLTGPTGSGKSTLLTLLAGIILPTGGEVVFNEIYLTRSREEKISQFRERHIGYVPQNPLFIRDLSVLENILSPNSFLKRNLKKMISYAMELLEILELEGKAKFFPHELSAGEKKMAMIIRALVKKPLYLLADEPIQELDEKTTARVLNLFDEQKRSGSAIFIVSHKPLPSKKGMDFYSMVDGCIKEYKKI